MRGNWDLNPSAGDVPIGQADGSYVPGPSSALGGVSQIIAGTDISVSPSGGTGVVTISTTGGGGIDELTGDITAGPGSGSQAATLPNVNANVGSFTNTNLTVNAKGLVTAAANGSGGGGGGALTNIATDVTVIGASIDGNVFRVQIATSTITIEAIPDTYTSILIIYKGATDGSTDSTFIMYLNSDTGGDYNWSRQGTSNSNASGDGDMPVGIISTVGGYGGGTILIEGYSDDFYAKMVTGQGAFINGAAFGNWMFNGWWGLSAVVDKITLIQNGSDNFGTDTWFTIYGVN